MALENAFEVYLGVKVIIVAHLYRTHGKVDTIKEIEDVYGAVIVKDAAESLGTAYKGIQIGTFGEYNCISFNGKRLLPDLQVKCY